ncbi:MAG TPA: glycosyltransferase family 87 protein [Candidatus Binataceae bacterium]|nr:glycosyltransferase family 87 protein [Candidatus Binataceae bacterium]
MLNTSSVQGKPVASGAPYLCPGFARARAWSGRRTYLIALIWICAAARYATLVPELPRRATDWNFDLYYVAGVAAMHGVDPARTDIAPLGRSLHCHMPEQYFSNATLFSRMAFEGLAHLPLRDAYWTWTGVNLAALAAAIAILLRVFALDAGVSAMLVGLLLLYPPVIDHLLLGETEFLLLFLLTAAFWLLRRNRDIPGGALLAVAALAKVYPFAMGGYLIASRKWAALFSAIVIGTAGIALLTLIYGTSAWLSIIQLDSRDTFLWSSLNLSLSGFLTRMYWRAFTALHDQTMRYALIVAAQLAIVALTYRTTRRRADEEQAQCYALWIVAILLLSPIVWLAYLSLLTFPIIVLAMNFARGRAGARTLAAMIVSAAILFSIAPFAPGLAQSRPGRVALELQFIALLSAYLSIYWLVKDGHADGASGESFVGPDGA